VKHGERLRPIAAQYSLHRSAIHRIIKRKNVEVPGVTGSETRPVPKRTVQNPDPIIQEPTPVSANGKASVRIDAGWLRALNHIRDFAAKSSEPRIAKLLDSVIREISGKKRGGR
jgi:hypothetical protein